MPNFTIIQEAKLIIVKEVYAEWGFTTPNKHFINSALNP